MKIKKGDTVKVIAGKDKGRIAEVIATLPKANKVVVEGVNIRKKAMKPTQVNPDGGIIEKEVGIDASNVVKYDGKKPAAKKKATKKAKEVKE